MKAIIFILMLAPTFAQARGNIFCKDGDGKPVSALSEDGRYKCAGWLSDGSACFTGSRSEVIDLLDSDLFNWDEEWLESAHYRGRDSIAYEYVDGPNGLREKLSMNRCDDAFFGR